MKKLMLAGLTAVLVFVAFVLTAVVLLPQLLINDLLFPVYLSTLKVVGIQAHAEKSHVAIWNQSLDTKHFELSAQNFCVRLSDTSFDACFDSLDLVIEFKLEKPILKVHRIDRIKIKSRSLEVRNIPAASSSKQSNLKFSDFFPLNLNDLHLGEIGIDAYKNRIALDKFKIDGDLYFKFDPVPQKDPLRAGHIGFDLHAMVIDKDGKVSGDQKLGLRSALDFSMSGIGQGHPLHVDGDIDFVTAASHPARLHLVSEFFGVGDVFSLQVKGDELCIDHVAVSLKGCISKLEVGTKGTFTGDAFSIIEFIPFHFAANHLKFVTAAPEDSSDLKDVDSETAQKAKVEQHSVYEIVWTSLVKVFGLHLRDVNVKIQDFQIITAGVSKNKPNLAPQFIANALVTEKGAQILVKGDVKLPGQKAVARLKIAARESTQQINFSGEARFQSPNVKVNTPIKISLNDKFGTIEVKPDLKILKSKLSAQANIKARLENQAWQISLSSLNFSDSNLVQVSTGRKKKCEIHIAQNLALKMECGLQVIPLSRHVNEYLAMIPLQTNFSMAPDAPPDPPAGAESAATWSGRLDVDSGKFNNTLLSGRLKTTVEGKNLNLQGQLLGHSIGQLLGQLDVNNHIRLQIPDFQNWVKRTRTTSFAIPAPLNALNGAVEVESVSSVQGSSQSSKLIATKIPFHIHTQLKGPSQSVVTDGLFKLEVVNSLGEVAPELTGEYTLNSVQLALPRLKLESPPPILPDRRIVVSSSKTALQVQSERETVLQKQIAETSFVVASKKSAPFKYSIHVLTENEHSLTILCNLAEQPIPITLDLMITSVDGLRGHINLLEFPASLFRRKAVLQRLNLNIMSGRSDENPIDGRVTVTINDYKIFVDLAGTMKTPIVKLSSDPQLSEAQIVSVLLFGKTTDQLDPDQSNSSQSLQSAIGDHALGLFSLYYLASTPIESVGYDSQQKVFSAKVRLQEGLSLDIGANQSSISQIGLNKRLGGSWMVRTFVTNPNDSRDQSVTAFLEKIFRY